MERKYRDSISKNKKKLSQKVSLTKIMPSLKNSCIFTKLMLEDIESEKFSLYDELPTRGPSAFSKFCDVLRGSGYEGEAEDLVNSVNSLIPPNRQIYKMDSDPIGFCLIINNEVFKEKSMNREGSSYDYEKLQHLFQKMGYHVMPLQDLSKNDMKSHLQTFAKCKGFLQADSCVVIILSHGDIIDNNDSIEGTDHEFLLKSDIYRMFASEPALEHKPKLFIFQSCRGQSVVKIIDTVSTDSCRRSDVYVKSDMLIVHATLPDHVAYRYPTGAVLCRHLYDVFYEYYCDWDVMEMLDEVDRRVKEQVVKGENGNERQVTHIEDGLKALLYFKTNKFCASDLQARQYRK